MAIVGYRVSSIFNWTIIDISLGGTAQYRDPPIYLKHLN